MANDKKYQVFISSTFIDLKDEREQAMKAVLEMGHIPIGMELFHASDETQWQLIQKRIDESDYYVLILAHRYGSSDDDGIGYTEKEYDYAISKGVPVLSFIIDESVTWLPKFIDKGKDLKKLAAFKAKASHKKVVQFWTNKDNLNSKIKSALQNQIIINPRNGWVRADETDYKNVASEIARLSEENNRLREIANNEEDIITKKIEHLYSTLDAKKYTLLFDRHNSEETIAELQKEFKMTDYFKSFSNNTYSEKFSSDIGTSIKINLYQNRHLISFDSISLNELLLIFEHYGLMECKAVTQSYSSTFNKNGIQLLDAWKLSSLGRKFNAYLKGIGQETNTKVDSAGA